MPEKLDRSRPFGLLFDRDKTYNSQDGKRFDMATDELVTDEPPAPSQEAPQVTNLECKLCGKTYKTGKTEAAKKRAVYLMKKHIETEHPDADL